MRKLIPVCFLAFVAGCGSGPVPNLDSGDPYERYLGALEAAHSDDAEEMKRVEAMLKDPDPLARIGAVVAFGHAQTPGSLALLTGMLSDPDPGVRTEAVRAIARFHDLSSIEPLVKVMKSDASVEPRRTAARELSLYPDSAPLREALLAAMSDPAAGVAYNAHRSLTRITGKEDLPRDRAAAEEALKRS